MNGRSTRAKGVPDVSVGCEADAPVQAAKVESPVHGDVFLMEVAKARRVRARILILVDCVGWLQDASFRLLRGSQLSWEGYSHILDLRGYV